MKPKEYILELLKNRAGGIYNHATQKTLANRCGISQRHVRELICELVAEGHPIGAGNNGFFYALDPINDLNHTVNRLECQNRAIVDRIFNYRLIIERAKEKAKQKEDREQQQSNEDVRAEERFQNMKDGYGQ